MSLVIPLDSVPAAQRQQMLAAGREVRECYRVLDKGDINLVGEVLKNQGEFLEMTHYPRDDVFDRETFGQYYYHAHRGPAEHGHFHLFVRAGGMPEGMLPLNYPLASAPWPRDAEAICHLIAISMDDWGFPTGLFCTNRWVTDETWYPAEQVIALLDRFVIDHAFPNWALNRWLGAMVRLYRPHIEALIRERDKVIAQWQQRQPQTDVFEDRALEITSYLPIDPDALIAQLLALEPV